MEVGSAKAQLKDVYVTMDSLADDREGIWTEDERQEIRLIQKTAKALVESCGENIDDIQDELDAVEEEMQS